MGICGTLFSGGRTFGDWERGQGLGNTENFVGVQKGERVAKHTLPKSHQRSWLRRAIFVNT